MKVALIHDYLEIFGGAERTLYHLSELYPEAPIITLTFNPALAARFPNRTITALARGRREWLLPRLPLIIESANFDDFDLVISNSNSFAHGIITRAETKHLCYCHSPARFLWDYSQSYQEERELRGIRSLGLPIIHWLRLWDYYASLSPDQYVANSQTVARRINTYYRRPAEVVYPPVEIDRFRPLDHPTRDYYLVVSRLSEYKKIDLAISACITAKRRLVIVGEGRDRNRLEQLSDPKWITFLDKQDDQQVAKLLANATALLHPQLEDFGITAVEAVASGTPVVAFGRGGATETILDGVHGVHFHRQTVKELVTAMMQLESMTFSPRLLRKQAEQFSVDRFHSQFKSRVDQLLSR